MQAFMGALIDWFLGAFAPMLVVAVLFGAVRRVNAKRLVLLLLFTMYICEMINIVGVPYVQFFAWNPTINPFPLSDLFVKGASFGVIFQYVANIAMFIPLGMLMPEIWTSFRSFGRTTAAGLLLTAGIEMTQLFTFRVTAVDDVLMNALGAMIGYSVLHLFRKKRWKSTCGAVNARQDILELLLLVCLAFASTIFLKYNLGALVY